jgi:hypothetical protein
MPNRSQGWTSAKKSGHRFEYSVADQLSDSSSPLVKSLYKTYGSIQVNKISEVRVPYGPVETVFGDRTEGKPDLVFVLPDGQRFPLSIKKSGLQPNGQAHLSTLDRFVRAWGLISGEELSPNVVEFFRLFIGEQDVLSLSALAPGVKPTTRKHRRTGESLDVYQVRLSPETIKEYRPEVFRDFVEWARRDAVLLADLFLFRGYASHVVDFASGIWFGRENRLVLREELLRAVDANRDVHIGSRGGTIQLAWGFLQFHAPRGRRQLQAHWQSAKILDLIR